MIVDDELQRAIEARCPDLYSLSEVVLDILGILGPVAAFNLALREMRKRVGENYHPLSESAPEVGAH